MKVRKLEKFFMKQASVRMSECVVHYYYYY